MTVVVDASLAIKWVLEEEYTEQALVLRGRWQDTRQQIMAPPIFRAEIANALHQRVRKREVSRLEATEMLDSLLALVVIGEPAGLYGRAMGLAGDLGLGSIYDALYLALAEYEGCELWTADQRLARQATPRLPLVRWVGEGRSKSG